MEILTSVAGTSPAKEKDRAVPYGPLGRTVPWKMAEEERGLLAPSMILLSLLRITIRGQIMLTCGRE